MFAYSIPRYIRAFALLNAIAIAAALMMTFVVIGAGNLQGSDLLLMVTVATSSVGLGSALYWMVHRHFDKAMVLAIATFVVTVTMMLLTFTLIKLWFPQVA